MEQFVARHGALAGIAFVVLALVGFAVEGSPPGVSDPPGDLVEWYGDNEAQVKAASAIAAVAAAAAVVFAAHLAAAIRNRSHGVLAAVALAGGVVAAAGVGVDSAARFALADTAGKITPEATQALFAFWDSFFWPMHLGIALTAIAVSASSLESKLVPSWLAGLGLVAGVLIFIPVVAVLVIGLIGIALWVVITSVVLFRQSSSSTHD